RPISRGCRIDLSTVMKVMTIFGTRPEIIRLSLVIKLLDRYCEHITVHTGQNYDKGLSDIFIRDLGVRAPDVHLGVRSNSFGEQIGQILTNIDNVMTEHRPDKVLVLGENVDLSERLTQIFGGLAAVAEHFQLPVLISVHPRTADKLIQHGIQASEDSIRLLDPLGFFDFVKLEKNARLVLTDSGTVQEECCIFGVPNVTVRDVTERPETLEAGSN